MVKRTLFFLKVYFYPSPFFVFLSFPHLKVYLRTFQQNKTLFIIGLQLFSQLKVISVTDYRGPKLISPSSLVMQAKNLSFQGLDKLSIIRCIVPVSLIKQLWSGFWKVILKVLSRSNELRLILHFSLSKWIMREKSKRGPRLSYRRKVQVIWNRAKVAEFGIEVQLSSLLIKHEFNGPGS